MEYKQISVRISTEILTTSKEIKEIALKEEHLTFFQLHTKSQNAWDCFVYQMGLIKIKQEFEKFKKQLEQDEI
jgi:hypothetical protein